MLLDQGSPRQCGICPEISCDPRTRNVFSDHSLKHKEEFSCGNLCSLFYIMWQHWASCEPWNAHFAQYVTLLCYLNVLSLCLNSTLTVFCHLYPGKALRSQLICHLQCWHCPTGCSIRPLTGFKTPDKSLHFYWQEAADFEMASMKSFSLHPRAWQNRWIPLETPASPLPELAFAHCVHTVMLRSYRPCCEMKNLTGLISAFSQRYTCPPLPVTVGEDLGLVIYLSSVHLLPHIYKLTQSGFQKRNKTSNDIKQTGSGKAVLPQRT